MDFVSLTHCISSSRRWAFVVATMIEITFLLVPDFIAIGLSKGRAYIRLAIPKLARICSLPVGSLRQ